MTEPKKIICVEEDCGGECDMAQWVSLMVGCAMKKPAFPCKKCGRLHWEDGEGVANRGHRKAFLVDGEVVHR